MSKNIILIGSEGLIGSELVRELKSAHKVIRADISAPKNNNDAPFYEVDIASEQSVESLIKNVVRDFSKIDCVINCAYPRTKTYGKSYDKVPLNDFNENVNLHLGGYFNILKNFMLFFKNQGHGNIISFSSIYGVIPPRFEIYSGTEMTSPVEYAAVKSGIIHLTKYFAKIARGTSIRVNSISPGGVEDGQNPSFIKRYSELTRTHKMLAPNNLAGPIRFLVSDEASSIHGQNIIVDDGFTL